MAKGTSGRRATEKELKASAEGTESSVFAGSPKRDSTRTGTAQARADQKPRLHMPHLLRRRVLAVKKSHTPTKNAPRKMYVAIGVTRRDITVSSVSLNECQKSAVRTYILDTAFLDTVGGEQTPQSS